MTTLAAVAPLLDRLFSDAEASNAQLRAMVGSMTPEERGRRMSDPNSDYRAFYGRAKDIHMAVSRETGKLLYMAARACKATSIVEFGTSFGISTIHLAAAIRDNGGGHLIGSDFEPNKLAHARANLAEAKLADLVEIREGDALETLARDLPASIDLVLFDGHKPLYPRILSLLEPHFHAGTVLIADNAEWAPDYLARVRGAGYVSVAFGPDVEFTVRA